MMREGDVKGENAHIQPILELAVIVVFHHKISYAILALQSQLLPVERKVADVGWS